MRALLILLFALLTATARAQPQIAVARPDADLFIHEWSEDEATITVTDRSGTAIRGLTAKDFTVSLDSNRPASVRSASITRITNAKSIALSFVLDNSASIFHGYDSITKYLDGFVNNMPGSVLMSAYVFDNRDRSRMHEATRRGDVFIAPSGDTEDRDSISRFWHFYDSIRSEFTPLYDELGTALWSIQARKNRGDTSRLNVVVVVSDGTDNASRTSIEDLLDHVMASDIRLYVLTYRTDPDRRLSWLAGRARGSSYSLSSLPEMSQALDDLRAELTVAYKIRFGTDKPGRRNLPKSPTLVRKNPK